MSAFPVETLVRFLRASRLALAIALGAALSANAALAGNIVQIGGGDPAVAGNTPVGTAGANVGTQSPSKLTLGLDSLSAEYQDYRQAVARGDAAAGTFTTTTTMARLIGDTVAVDAVAAGDAQALKTALEALGARVMAVAGRIVSAQVPLNQLSALDGVAALQFARPVLATTHVGAVTSQGDPAQRSQLVRGELGLDGSGSVIGVLSDSFDCVKTPGKDYTNDVGTGDLPVGVNVLADQTSGCSDEGRAMAQVVHDVAPGAGLAFHTAYNGEADFAQGIRDLAAAGAKIVVDDVIYFTEPMFQDGVVAQAVDAVRAQGVAYFAAAGNEGRQAYQAPFRDSGSTGSRGSLHDFDSGSGVVPRLRIRQSADTTYVMQWQDRHYSVSGTPGAGSNLDICFFSPVGEAEPFACTVADNAGGDPIEIARITGTGDLEITIERRSGPSPNPVKIVGFGSIAFLNAYAGTSAGTIYGHANAAGANAVGATAYFLAPAFGTTPPVLNYFSSAGNTPILFNTVGTPISETRQKPEFTAPDGGNNTFFGSDYERDGWPNFFGTSAAAPHAAGVAALLRDAIPTLTPSQITTVLKGTAIDVLQRVTGSFTGPRIAVGTGYDNDSGSGLIDARAAANLKANTATTVISGLNPATFGDPVRFTAKVSPSTATGTVTFKDAATILGPPTALSGGSAAYSTAILAVGSHSITAVYAGDASYNGSTSPVLVQTVNKCNTTTTLVSSPNPSIFGQSVNLTATVSPAAATGTVTFKEGTTNLGTATLSGGTARLSTTTLAVGSHSITTVYVGDTNCNGSTSAGLVQTVNKGNTTTTLASSLNPSTFGQPVNLTARVSPAAATGTVTFKEGTLTLGTVTLSGGTATVSIATLAVGSHSITAVYGGDANYNGSTSAVLVQTVNKANTTTTVVSDINPAAAGRSVTFTARVSPAGAGGTVIFKDGTVTLGTAPLSGGSAVYSTATLAIGSHSITAVYSGDANTNGSTSAALAQTVIKDDIAAWLPAVLSLVLD